MVLAPVNRLKKTEIVWLARHRCKHRHTYLEHFDCYKTELPQEGEKIGFLDIETSQLKANFGLTFCYCIKPLDSATIVGATITERELKSPILDRRIITQCVSDLQNFDRIVGFYSTRFDLPFIRTRALEWQIPFPEYGELAHTDVYYIARNKLALHSNRLESVADAILGKTRKSHLKPRIWVQALQGNKQALNYIYQHCQADVRDLQDVYLKLVPFAMNTKRSI